MSRKSSHRVKDSCLFPFHSVWAIGSVTATNLPLAPNSTLTPRGAIEADSWAHFRVLRFKFRVLSNSVVTNQMNLALGYIGGVQDTPPASASAVMELIPSVLYPATQTIPTRWVTVPKEDLVGPFPWYKTVLGTAGTTEEAPGYLAAVPSQYTGTNGTVYVEVYGLFEFKTSVATANTPVAIALRSRVREERVKTADDDERARIVKLLSPILPPSLLSANFGTGSRP